MNEYNKKEFEELINSLLNNAGFDSVQIYELINQDAKKWYDKTYTSNFENIKENTRYGVQFNGVIQYDFKSGQIENLLKSFLIKFTANHKEYKVIDGKIQVVNNKKEYLDTIIKANQDRVYNGLFYTTLYGIGFWFILSSSVDVLQLKKMKEYLNGQKIAFTNEFSEAGWVYRFKINKSIETHNSLLTEYKKSK